MRIAISGARGLIGSALGAALAADGHDPLRIVRTAGAAPEGCIRWNDITGTLDRKHMEGVEAVVHLAGENIAGRWTPEKKERIRNSRVVGTRLLVEALAGLPHPPRVLLTASALGFYGDRSDTLLTEASAPGNGFLAEVCVEWEAATELAAAAGIRVAPLRFGFVLSRQGGGLPRLLKIFRLGLGGRLGNGRQYMSWISLTDAVRAIQFTLSKEQLSGPMNVVAPQPVTNREFTKTLGRVLSRPAFWPVPAWALVSILGEMGQEVLLNSARVDPSKLTQAGFTYQHPVIENALQACCKKQARP